MNILIEDAEKLEYLTSSNHWTKIPAEAKIFRNTAEAVAVGKQQHMGKFNVVAYVSTTHQFVNFGKGCGRRIPEGSAALSPS